MSDNFGPLTVPGFRVPATPLDPDAAPKVVDDFGLVGDYDAKSWTGYLTTLENGNQLAVIGSQNLSYYHTQVKIPDGTNPEGWNFNGAFGNHLSGGKDWAVRVCVSTAGNDYTAIPGEAPNVPPPWGATTTVQVTDNAGTSYASDGYTTTDSGNGHMRRDSLWGGILPADPPGGMLTVTVTILGPPDQVAGTPLMAVWTESWMPNNSDNPPTTLPDWVPIGSRCG
jgi:hypothetical protein